MSWHYLQVQGGESSEGVCSDGEPLPPLKSKITHAEFYSKGKLTDSYLDSLSGTISAHLTEPSGEGESMLSAVDFPVRTYQPQEVAKESAEKGQGSGGKWHALLARYDRDSHSWRTAQCSLFEDLELSLETWPKWGLMRDGECWEQTPLAHPIKETVFGFYVPTPTSSDGTSGAVIGKNDQFYQTKDGKPRKINQKGNDGAIGLGRLVQMWPTPNAWDGRRGPRSEENLRTKNHQINLITAIKMKERENFPTPNARDWKDGKTSGNRKSPGLGVVAHSGTSSGGQLNPTWVEWLMGWPIGWTDLNPLAMGRSPSALQQHGES